jgi:hypothetical protein
MQWVEDRNRAFDFIRRCIPASLCSQLRAPPAAALEQRGVLSKISPRLSWGFLKWGYNLGDATTGGDKNQKMTAYVAEEVMKLVGTAVGEVKYTTCTGVDLYMKANSDGLPSFRVRDLLDVWRIKPWFSTQKQAFNTKLETAAKAAAARIAAMEGVCLSMWRLIKSGRCRGSEW